MRKEDTSVLILISWSPTSLVPLDGKIRRFEELSEARSTERTVDGLAGGGGERRGFKLPLPTPSSPRLRYTSCLPFPLHSPNPSNRNILCLWNVLVFL